MWMDENGYFDCEFEAFGEGWYRSYDVYPYDFTEGLQEQDIFSQLEYLPSMNPYSAIKICPTDTRE